MKNLLIISAIILASCSKDETEPTCNCQEVTKTKVVKTTYFNGGSVTETSFKYEKRNLPTTNCDMNGIIILDSELIKKYIECN